MNKIIIFLTFVSIIFLFVTKGALGVKGSQVLYEDNFASLDPDGGSRVLI